MKPTPILFLIFSSLAISVLAEESAEIALCRVVEEPSDTTKRMTLPDGDSAIFVETTPIITEEHVASASVDEGQEQPTLIVRVRMTDPGARILGAATKKMIDDRLAILIRGQLVSAPVVKDPFSSAFSITGGFDREWAEAFVRKIDRESEE